MGKWVNSPRTAKLAAWVREELQKRSLSYADVAAMIGLPKRQVQRRLEVGLPERGNYRGWTWDFLTSLEPVFGLHAGDLVVLGGEPEHSATTDLFKSQEKQAKKLNYKGRLVVCGCRKAGMLLIGPNHTIVYSVIGAGWMVQDARAQSWVTMDRAVKLTRTFFRSGLPIHDPEDIPPRPSLHKNIFDQLLPEEQARLPFPRVLETCEGEPEPARFRPSAN